MFLVSSSLLSFPGRLRCAGCRGPSRARSRVPAQKVPSASALWRLQLLGMVCSPAHALTCSLAAGEAPVSLGLSFPICRMECWTGWFCDPPVLSPLDCSLLEVGVCPDCCPVLSAGTSRGRPGLRVRERTLLLSWLVWDRGSQLGCPASRLTGLVFSFQLS